MDSSYRTIWLYIQRNVIPGNESCALIRGFKIIKCQSVGRLFSLMVIINCDAAIVYNAAVSVKVTVILVDDVALIFA